MRHIKQRSALLKFKKTMLLTAVVTKSSILWDTTPCSQLKVNRRFGGTRRLRLYGRALLPTCLRWLPTWLILRPWRWRRLVLPKYQLTFNGLHGVISQKIVLFGVMFNWQGTEMAIGTEFKISQHRNNFLNWIATSGSVPIWTRSHLHSDSPYGHN
jgi:hypothetical protein